MIIKTGLNVTATAKLTVIPESGAVRVTGCANAKRGTITLEFGNSYTLAELSTDDARQLAIALNFLADRVGG